MSFKTAQNAITAHFASGWATTIAYDNVEYTPPNPPAAWVRITVQPGLGESASLGATLERQYGDIFVQVFTPENTGTATAADTAQNAADRLRFKRIARTGDRDVRTFAASIKRIGNSDGWYQINVTIPFEYDDSV